MIICYWDGAITKNPGGEASSGYVIERNGCEIARECRFLESKSTVNRAEYLGLEVALHAAYQLRRTGEPIELRGDSQFVVNTVRGDWKMTKAHLIAVRDRCQELIRGLGAIVAWIPREQNKADECSRAA